MPPCKPFQNARASVPPVARTRVCASAEQRHQRVQQVGALVGAASLAAAPALASPAAMADTILSVGAIAGVAGIGGLLIAADPQKRRSAMAEGAGGDEMASVREYFDNDGARFCIRCMPWAAALTAERAPRLGGALATPRSRSAAFRQRAARTYGSVAASAGLHKRMHQHHQSIAPHSHTTASPLCARTRATPATLPRTPRCTYT